MAPLGRRKRAYALEGALVAVTALYACLAPYTKVEESFSLHAVRDILTLGLSPDVLSQYDHVTFPGAVPRSFIGPLALAGATWPFLWLGKLVGFWTLGIRVQLLVRLVLGALTCASLIFLARRVRDAYNQSVADIFLLLTITQFHVLFWASRTLPNMFAFPLVQVAIAMIVAPWPRRTKKGGKGSRVEVLESFAVLTFVGLVMRLEVLAYLAPLALFALRRGTVTLDDLVKVGVVMSAISLGDTILIDSHFWGRTLWPEGSSLMFNVVEGRASDWGTSPWHYYFTRALPRLVPSLPLGIWSMVIDRRSRGIGYPSLLYIVALSFLSHKEWRFFVSAIPALNICSAAGVHTVGILYSRRMRRLALAACLALNLAVAGAALYGSTHNYPGGTAIVELGRLRRGESDARKVHIDSHAAMTGASRFLHPHETPLPWYLTPTTEATIASAWTFDKNETLTDFRAFDYLVAGTPERQGFRVVHPAKGFKGYRLRWPEGSRWWGWPIEIVLEDDVWILQRNP